MKKYMSQREKENLKRPLKPRGMGILLAGILCSLIGHMNLLLIVLIFNPIFDIHIIPVGMITVMLTGIIIFSMGVYGIVFSQVKEVSISADALVVFETRNALIGAVLSLFMGSVFMVVSTSAAVADSYICWFTGLIGVLFLGMGMVCFSAYQNRRIIVKGNRITGMTMFGQRYSYIREEIGDIKFSIWFGSYKVMSREGAVLFRFENNMVNAKLLFKELDRKVSSRWVDPGTEVLHIEEEVLWNPEDETWQTRNVRGIKIGLRILVVLNILLTVWLLFICPDWLLKAKYRVFVIELQPLIYLFYSWVFRDVVTYLGSSEIKASEEWKKMHIGLGMPLFHSAFIMLFVTINLVWNNINVLEEENIAYGIGVLLFAILFGVSIIRLSKTPKKKLVIVTIAFFMALLSMQITPAWIQASSIKDKDTHYDAKIRDYRISRSRYFNSYYVTVELQDGEEKELSVTHSVYKSVEAGQNLVVCEKEAPFGIRFATMHLE